MMDRSTRNAAIAAAIIMVGFGLVAFYLPNIMLAVGDRSPAAAGGVVGVLFVAAFFLVFWLRGRSRRDRND